MNIGDLHELWCCEANLSHLEVNLGESEVSGQVNNGPVGERFHIHGESDWKKSVKNFAPKLSSLSSAAIRKHI